MVHSGVCHNTGTTSSCKTAGHLQPSTADHLAHLVARCTSLPKLLKGQGSTTVCIEVLCHVSIVCRDLFLHCSVSECRSKQAGWHTSNVSCQHAQLQQFCQKEPRRHRITVGYMQCSANSRTQPSASHACADKDCAGLWHRGSTRAGCCSVATAHGLSLLLTCNCRMDVEICLSGRHAVQCS